MKRILALFALAFAASPLMAELPTNPRYLCSGAHKYTVTIVNTALGWAFPCLTDFAAVPPSLDRFINQEKCLSELMLNWTTHNLTFTKQSSANDRTQAKLIAQLQAAVSQVNAGAYTDAYSNIVRASNKISDLIKGRKVNCAEGEDILLASFDATNGLDLILAYPPVHPE